jgi:hypothetical protein
MIDDIENLHPQLIPDRTSHYGEFLDRMSAYVACPGAYCKKTNMRVVGYTGIKIAESHVFRALMNGTLRAAVLVCPRCGQVTMMALTQKDAQEEERVK